MAKTPRARLSHFNAAGAAHMVDVGAKAETARVAIAEATVEMADPTARAIRAGKIGKGDVLGIARVAGLAALKRTAELIPLCHPVRVVASEIDFALTGARLRIRVTVRAFDRTGVEMEAMTAAAVSALTVYDMCKAIDRGMRITGLVLVEKSGGKSGTWRRPRPAK